MFQDLKLKTSLQANQYQITPNNLKQFLIDQLKTDQETLKKPKEVLFIGRSNVGKSSLINAILEQKVALCSQKTGSTLRLSFHHIPTIHGYLVDSPGFGYSRINVDAQKLMQGMISTYTRLSSRLCRIYFLINIQHGIKENDKVMLKLLEDQKINIQIVLTKADKIKENQLHSRQLFLAKEIKQFKNIHPILHTVSTRVNFGIQDLQCSLIDSFYIYQSRNLLNLEEKLIKMIQARKRPEKLDLNRIIKQSTLKLENKSIISNKRSTHQLS